MGRVTEIYGQPGVGKTQFCLQLCSNVQLPKSIGGLQAKCIFLDCEGGFSVQRLSQICQATSNVAKTTDKSMKNVNLLNGVLYKRIEDISGLNTALDEIVAMNLNVKLLVIDSIAFHFRYPLISGNLPNVSSILQNISQKLNALAYQRSMAIIVTNQMTTRVPSQSGDLSELIPALGESWSHSCSSSIGLNFTNNASVRKLNLVKSPFVKANEARFVITEDGIRDCLL